MIGGELENAVAEPDVPGALARCREKGFRRRRMGIFLQKMVLHHPGVVIAEPVGGLELRQRVLVELELIALLPRARQLQLIEYPEFHERLSLRGSCTVLVIGVIGGILIAGSAKSTVQQFRETGDALR